MARDEQEETVGFGDAEANAQAELLASAPRFENPYDGDLRERKEQQGKYGCLYAGEYEWSNQRCTREAYGDSRKHATGRHFSRSDRNRRSLYFHTTWMSAEPAVKCIQEVPEYNRFHPDYVAGVVENFPHPAVYVVGRESSPVLYVWTYHPAAFMDRISSIRDAYMADLENGDEADVFAPAGPDELGAVESPSTFPGVGVGEPADAVTDGETAWLVRCWFD